MRKSIKKALPSADVRHVGSTSVSGALTKGDVDLLVLVESSDYLGALQVLETIYEVDQPENWRDSYASFKDTSQDLSVGIQLPMRGDSDERIFIGFRDLLIRNPEILRRYNELKRGKEGASAEDYTTAKAAFIQSVLDERLPE